MVLPFVQGYCQPMAAGCRTNLVSRINKLLEAPRLRPAHLFEECNVRQFDDAELLSDARLASVDPDLDSAVNVNERDGYRAAARYPRSSWSGTVSWRLAAEVAGHASNSEFKFCAVRIAPASGCSNSS